MKTIKTINEKVSVKYSEIDRLFYIEFQETTIHAQQSQPNETEIIEALISDNWEKRFEAMRKGERVRISNRIYYEMRDSVPPLRFKTNSFYCGEPYSGNYHYYFEIEDDGKRYGLLRKLV